jgi:hypothetical protein
MKDIEMDIIYDYVDLLCKNKDYLTLNSILEINKDRNLNNIDEKITYLTATLPVKSKLASRELFYLYFQNYLISIKYKDTINLLKGLK